MIMHHPMTASDLAGETTATADTEKDCNEWKVEGLDRKRRCCTRKEDFRLMALKKDLPG